MTADGTHLEPKPFDEDLPDLDDPYRMRQHADRLSTLSDLANELFNDIKADQPNVPGALRRDLRRYGQETAKPAGEIRPQYLRSRMKVFTTAQGDQDIRAGLGNYALTKFNELIDEHTAVMTAFYSAQIERLRKREGEPLTADATHETIETALDQVIDLTDGPDWANFPKLPEALSEELVDHRDTLHAAVLKLAIQPEHARAEGARQLAIENRVYLATAGQAVGRAVEYVAANSAIRAAANLGSATSFLNTLGRILGF